MYSNQEYARIKVYVSAILYCLLAVVIVDLFSLYFSTVFRGGPLREQHWRYGTEESPWFRLRSPQYFDRPVWMFSEDYERHESQQNRWEVLILQRFLTMRNGYKLCSDISFAGSRTIFQLSPFNLLNKMFESVHAGLDHLTVWFL